MDFPPSTIDDRRPIGVDIDNVIAATDKKIRQLIKEYFGIDSTQSDITNWHYSLSLPMTPQDEQFIFDQFHDQACLDVRVLPGARQSLNELARLFQIYLITNRPPTSKAITRSWLHKKRLPYDQVFFLQDKSILAHQLYFVVEDRLETALSFINLGVPVFLFDYPWNRAPEQPNLHRVNSWSAVLSNLSRLHLIPAPFQSALI